MLEEIEFQKSDDEIKYDDLLDVKLDELLISIIIPLYNEEHSIKNVINRIPNHVKNEIIIVDDGSTDDSVTKINRIYDKKIKLKRHFKNRGYGAAILTGIKNATGDIIVTLDSDGQHNPEEIPLLIEPIINNQADIVVGSRYLGRSTYKVPLHTRAGEFIVKKCLWYMFRQNIANNQSGFRAINKKGLKIFENLIFSKFGLCTELLFKAGINGLRICEVPITISKREHGVSYNKIMEICKSILSCIILYFLKRIKIGRIIPKRYWDKIYNNIIKHLKKLY